MLKRLKRWLGWDSDSGLLDFADLGSRRRTGTPAAKPPAAPAATPRPAAAAGTGQRRVKAERSPIDVLENPRLSLDKPADDGFDPYNTGAFNRSQSWEKIGRQRKR